MFLKKLSYLIIFISFLFAPHLHAQIKYPFPVKYITINIDDQDTKMAYMDIKPAAPNGESVILFHGKNFTALYWKEVIEFLNGAGYRVIAPDQGGDYRPSPTQNILLKCWRRTIRYFLIHYRLIK